MSTIALQPNGDLLLPTVGQGVSGLVTDPATAAALKIASGLSILQGEWFLDTRIGFPWKQIWGQKPPNLVAIRQLLRKAILALGAPTVISVDDIAIFSSANRNISYTFAAKTNSGAVITGGEGVPFIVKTASGASTIVKAA